MDGVIVRDLRVQTRIGVTDEERRVPQTVLVSLEVSADLGSAAASDDLAETIDYGVLVERVAELVEGAENRLLEKLAGDIAALIEGFKGVAGVTVELAKANPPIAEDVERVAVRIERKFA